MHETAVTQPERASGQPFPRWSAGRDVLPEDRPPAPAGDSRFMPLPGEPVAVYVERLRAMHRQLTLLIAAVERGASGRPAGAREGAATAAPPVSVVVPSVPVTTPPASGPAPPRPIAIPAPVPQASRAVAPAHPAADGERRSGGGGRRAGSADRRLGLHDRRRGLPDARLVRVERRVGHADRRTGRPDRRGSERRRPVTVAYRGFQVDLATIVWTVQVLVWIAVATIAMVYGTG